MSDLDALERRLLAPKAKGTPDELWLLVTRRASLAEGGGDAKQVKQHLAMAALFAGRGFKAGERDTARLTTYLALFREAQAKQCFPLQLQATEARIINELRAAGGISEPEILTKKAKSVFTHVALYLVSDETSFDTISHDDSRWADDEGMRATVQAGLGLFIYTGADGTTRHEVRVVDRDDLALGSREYKNLTSSSAPVLLALPSGRLRLGQPLAKRDECLEVEVEAGVYRVALYNLSNGEKCVVIAARTNLESALNQLPESEPRYGQSIGGILNT
ncbi:MAG: hypothetical protein KF819_21850 [Labilithrix sp.]|nr:hypothetical protein [Labilithrix sp.]